MRRVPWTRQPPYPCQLDKHWVSRGLVLAITPDWYATPDGVFPMAKVGSPANSPGKLGPATGFGTATAGNTNSYLTGPKIRTKVGGYRSYIVQLYARSFGGGNLGRVFQPVSGTGADGSASNDESMYIQGVSSDRLLYSRLASIGYYNQFLQPTSLALNVWQTLGFSHDQTNGQSILPVGYRDGIYEGDWSLTVGNGQFTLAQETPLAIGNRPSDVTRTFDGQIGIQLFFDKFLSPQDHALLGKNPSLAFEPYTVLEVPAASGPTSYTLIASGGSYTATGSTAILNRNRKLTANGASYTVTGGTAALLRSKRLTLQGGSYNLTGASATLLRSKRITAQGGSYTLLGSSASIFKSRVLLASGGSYVLNGQQITITYTPTAGAYTLTALGGSYTITGSSAVLKRNRSLTAQGGSYALSGASSIIYRSRNLIAQGGSYTTTGSVATLHHNKLLIASGGVYSVAGSQASLLRSKLLTAQGGSYTVTGQQANLSRNRILQALGGAYLISGGSVVIQRSGMVWPSPDQVLLGVQYGPTGADYVGTMDVFGIKYDIVTGNLIKPISDKVVMTL